ncbi:MAG: SMP-30/gluconolactonase/LRE family protein [Nevskia sp.]|nr:SMP-30/gluconolactonase/LRE family protein [Nevskia sp.]
MRLQTNIALVVLAASGYLLFWPVPIDPAAWTAPPSPALTGPYALNQDLGPAQRLGTGVGEGPETVTPDAEGGVVVGYKDGRIERFAADGSRHQTLANTGGRPFGHSFDTQGNLIIADGLRGLLRLTPGGKLETLSTQAGGVPFRFPDDVAVAHDGTIYFSDASSKFGPAMLGFDDVLEHRGHGRLLKYDPASGQTSVLLDGLQFANGVTVGPDDAYVLVNETGSYDVLRYWLKGDQAGRHEVFIGNLPGLPDGICFNGRDTFWLALVAPRDKLLDAMADLPFLRRIPLRLPQALQPGPARYGMVLNLDLDGKVRRSLQDPRPQGFAPITDAKEANGYLYLGSVYRNEFARLRLSAP